MTDNSLPVSRSGVPGTESDKQGYYRRPKGVSFNRFSLLSLFDVTEHPGLGVSTWTVRVK